MTSDERTRFGGRSPRRRKVSPSPPRRDVNAWGLDEKCWRDLHRREPPVVAGQATSEEVIAAEIVPKSLEVGKGSDVAELVLDFFENDPRKDHLQALVCLSVMLLVEQSAINAEKIVLLGGATQIVSAMLSSPTYPVVQRFGCGALNALANRSGDQSNVFAQISVAGGVTAILRAANNYMDSTELQLAATEALNTFVLGDPSCAEAFVSNDGILTVAAIMRAHPCVASVQDRCCSLLASAADVGLANNGQAIAELVVTTMRSYSTRSDLQKCSCMALHGLAKNSAEQRDVIANAGGIELIIRCMGAFESQAELQRWACAALGSMSGQEVDCVHGSTVGKLGGVEMIVNSMRLHSSVANVQAAGCGALGALAHCKSCQHRIVTCGGVEATMEAMATHSTDPSVQAAGCVAFAGMEQGSSDEQHGSWGSSALDMIVTTMQTHAANQHVQTVGIEALRSLATTSQSRCQLVADLASDVISEAMRRFPAVLAVQENGCRILAVIDLQFAAKNHGVGVVDVIVNAMRSHNGSLKLQRYACEALLNLARGHVDCCVTIASNGGVEALVDLMRKHTDSLLHESVCLVFKTLVTNATGTFEEIPSSGSTCTTGVSRTNRIEALIDQASNQCIMQTARMRGTVKRMNSASSLTTMLRLGRGGLHKNATAYVCAQISTLGGLEVIVATLSTTESDRTRETCCRTLQMLISHDPMNAERVVDSGGLEVVLRMVKAHPANAGLLEVGLGMLAALLTGTSDHAEKVVSLGGIDIIISSMRRHRTVKEVLLGGCKCLEGLAIVQQSFVATIVASGGLRTLLASIVDHKNDEDMYEAVWRAFAEVVSIEPVVVGEFLITENGFEMLHRCMMNASSRSKVQEAACNLLARLLTMTDEPIAKRVLNRSLLGRVVAAMREHVAVAAVQKAAFRTVCASITKDAGCRLDIGEVGGVEAIVMSMQNNPWDTELQQLGCSAVESLVERCRENAEKVTRPGGIEAILGAMSSNPEDEGVLLPALSVVSVVAETDATIREKVVACGGIAQTLSAMQKRPNDGDWQERCLKALHSLTIESRDGVAEVFRLSGEETVVQTVRKYRSFAAVQHVCCMVLSNLILHSNEHQAENLGARSIELVVLAMTAFASHPGVQEAGCNVIHGMASHGSDGPEPQNLERIKTSAAIPVILDGMRENQSCASVQVSGLAALQSCTFDDDGIQQLVVNSGGVEASVNAMTSHLGAAEVQEFGCAVLESLTSGDAATAARVVVGGGVEAILKAMKTHSGDQGVQEFACGTLSNLCSRGGPTCRNRIRELRGAEVLRATLRNHPKDQRMQDLCSRVLSAIHV